MQEKLLTYVNVSGAPGAQRISINGEFLVIGAVDNSGNMVLGAANVLATPGSECLDVLFNAEPMTLQNMVYTDTIIDKSLCRTSGVALETTTTWARVLVLMVSSPELYNIVKS